MLIFLCIGKKDSLFFSYEAIYFPKYKKLGQFAGYFGTYSIGFGIPILSWLLVQPDFNFILMTILIISMCFLIPVPIFMISLKLMKKKLYDEIRRQFMIDSKSSNG